MNVGPDADVVAPNAELQLRRESWDGPYDWNAETEEWVCQAHGVADCHQSPMCEHYGRIKAQELAACWCGAAVFVGEPGPLVCGLDIWHDPMTYPEQEAMSDDA